MKEIRLEELKKIEFEILVYIDQVCQENDLRYSLCGGTLLGAVRHKGFIPWDDDIDICMPRSDYDRFIEILKETKSKYKILSPQQENYYYNFSKVVDSETMLIENSCRPIDNMGVYVDVFPLEGMPSNERGRKKHFRKLDKVRKRINCFSLLKPRIRKNLIEYAKCLYLYNENKNTSLLKFQKEYENLAKQYAYDDSEYVYMSGGAYGKTEVFPKFFVNDVEKVMFEKRQFTALKNYDLYLMQLYGDYMKLPPKDKQITHHHFTAQYRKID